jgi:molybdenum cofactor biosynthesis enzyme
MTGFTQFDADGRAVTVDISGKETTERCASATPVVNDMCKAVDRSIRITDVRVVRNSGGKAGSFNNE